MLQPQALCRCAFRIGEVCDYPECEKRMPPQKTAKELSAPASPLIALFEKEISTALDIPEGPYDMRYMEGRKAGLEWGLGQVEKSPAASPVEEIGQKLKLMREKEGLTPKDVLDKTGISPVYLARLENGELKSHSASVLYKLSELYKIDLKPLLVEAGAIIKKSAESKPSPVIEIGELPEKIREYLNAKMRPYHNRVSFRAGALELWDYLQDSAKASHPAPAPIVVEREERKYPIGGYAPGNYYCNCVTCKEKFQGDKRAVQCEPCAIKMVEDSGGKDYAHIHVSLPNGATATVSPDASPELLNALTKMVDLAKAMLDAPTEQALPEGVDEADYYTIQKLNEWHVKQLRECQTELRAANVRIKELQEWHDSHL